MSQTGESLREFWLRQDIKLNSGASADELASFETNYTVRLPDDLRDYFASVNGFADAVDDNGITFLRFDEMKPLAEYWSPQVADADYHFVFADYSISAFVYAIRLSNDLGKRNPVVVVYDSQPVEVANSFSEFVVGYLGNKNAVLFPEPRI